MSDFSSIADQKKALRVGQAALRRAAYAAGGPDAFAALARHLDVAPGDLVAGYWPLADEFDPRPAMISLVRAGCRLCLPVVVGRDRPLQFRTFAFDDPLEAGAHGTLHPSVAAPVVLPQVILVPLLAFDRRCYRLGYGGGYYDRTLESLREKVQFRTIGVGFAAQEVATVPRDAHDQCLDAVATERELIVPEST